MKTYIESVFGQKRRQRGRGELREELPKKSKAVWNFSEIHPFLHAWSFIWGANENNFSEYFCHPITDIVRLPLKCVTKWFLKREHLISILQSSSNIPRPALSCDNNTGFELMIISAATKYCVVPSIIKFVQLQLSKSIVPNIVPNIVFKYCTKYCSKYCVTTQGLKAGAMLISRHRRRLVLIRVPPTAGTGSES